MRRRAAALSGAELVAPDVFRVPRAEVKAALQLEATTATLLSDARRWSQQLERIDALSRQLSRSRDVHSVAEAVANQVSSVIDWHGLRF